MNFKVFKINMLDKIMKINNNNSDLFLTNNINYHLQEKFFLIKFLLVPCYFFLFIIFGGIFVDFSK